jgi:hypothetical protein
MTKLWYSQNQNHPAFSLPTLPESLARAGLYVLTKRLRKHVVVDIYKRTLNIQLKQGAKEPNGKTMTYTVLPGNIDTSKLSF